MAKEKQLTNVNKETLGAATNATNSPFAKSSVKWDTLAKIIKIIPLTTASAAEQIKAAGTAMYAGMLR